MKSKMHVNRILIWLCLTNGLTLTAFGFSSDGSSVTRSFDKTTTLLNTTVTVTATFTNAGSDSLRGFYYSEQIPTGLTVTTLSVTVNGTAISNYTFEQGQAGDVYSSSTPCRWILERPTGFGEANPVPAHGNVQIVYTVSSPVSGSFSLAQFSWAGYRTSSSTGSFGYSENADQQSLMFVHPVASRLDVDRQIRDFKAGSASQSSVTDLIKVYMQNSSNPLQ